MARTKAPLVAISPTGGLLQGAAVTIVNRATQAAATIYATEFAGGTLPQPLTTDSRGRVAAWLDRGPYTATFTYPGLSGWSEDFDSSPGADNSLDSGWIADNALQARHIPAGLITLAKLAAEVLPSGLLVPWGGSTAPFGWLLCDGSLVSRTTYAALFTLVGHAFNGGADPGSGNFKLPDLRGRTVHGADNFGVGAANRLPNLAAAAKVIGGTSGEDYHAMTVAEMPAHSHGEVTMTGSTSNNVAVDNNDTPLNAAGGSTRAPANRSTQNTGGSAPFNIMQPNQMASWIVKT